MRVDHWVKNSFVVPGILFGFALTKGEINIIEIIVGMFSVCFASSANYVINEWLDRHFDKFHPTKKNRPSVATQIQPSFVYLLYILNVIFALSLSFFVSERYFWGILILLIMGLIYNVKPLRSKDRPYLDVISESFNNPIRLYLGWVLVDPMGIPPSSLVISYWMSGAFLMGVKRYSELRFIQDPSQAGLYRKSFTYYTPEKLLGSALFYAICAAFFGGVFLVRHKLDLIIMFPFYSLLFAWYLMIGFKENSATQHPEKLFQEKALLAYSLFLLIGTFWILIGPATWISLYLVGAEKL